MSLIEECCYAPHFMLLDLGLGSHGLSLIAPAEQKMLVSDQPQMNSGLMIPEAETDNPQAQLEQHCRSQSEILKHGS